MRKTSLKDDAFVKGRSGSDPYKGGIEKGISYDDYDSKCYSVMENEGCPLHLPGYRILAKQLIKHLSLISNQKILDVGSGTGTSTLELFLKNPNISVVGIEDSEGMLQIARYKFHQISSDDLKLNEFVNDEILLNYFDKFRIESKDYKDKVKFILDDIETTNQIDEESMDGVIANMSLHWTDLSNSFKQIYRFLKERGEVVFNTSSHFYNNQLFNTLEYDFRLNDFVKYFLEEISKNIDINPDYHSLVDPKHNFDSFRSIASEQGFELEQVSTNLNNLGLQVIISTHILPIVGQLNLSEVKDERLDEVIRNALAITINNPKALGDIKHIYAINTDFRMVKNGK